MLKMNDLVKLTNTPKSTILYYIKEGLLPEPLKDKPNFHLYDESNIKLIEFIRYLQTNFNASISQIKTLFENEQFDFNNPYESLMHGLAIIMGAEDSVFSPTQLCTEFAISESELMAFVQDGLLSPRNGLFTAKEREILAIICNSNQEEREMLRYYSQLAKTLAEKEVALSIKALDVLEDEDKEIKLKQLLDLLLIVKPYILNMHTLNTYQNIIK